MNYTQLIEIVLILLIAAGSFYCLFSIVCVLEFFGARKGEPRDAPSVPVSIVKPLKGMDPELPENLRSFFIQDYPEYEVLLGFTDESDRALPAAREMAAASESVRVVISRKKSGVNEKVSNIEGLIKEASYPLVAISDSDMRVDPYYLKRIIGEYYADKNVGLVTSLYKVSSPVSIGAALESLTVALDFIPSVLVARRLEGVTFGLGASMLLSKKAIENIGDLSYIADYLADDYHLGNRLWRKGYKIILSDYVIEDVVGHMSIAEYFMHQLRWARTYRACRPKGFFGYGITHIFPFSLFLVLLLGPTPLSLSLFAAVLAVRFGLGLIIYRKVIRSRKWLKWLALLPLKDVLGFGIWLWSFMGREVFWRGKYFVILEGGRIKEKSG